MFSFYHGTEAQEFDLTVTEPRSRGAVALLHQLVLEASGLLPLYYLTHRLNPSAPLDLLVVHQAVAETFRDWRETLLDKPELTENRQKVVGLNEASIFVDSLSSNEGRIGLRNFITVLLSMNLPQDASIDLLFCCELLATFFGDASILHNILNGAVAKELDRVERGGNPWEPPNGE